MSRLVAANGWTFGLVALLLVLLIATKFIQPDFGISGLDSLGRAALPFALATLGMAVVVIAGGIDLSLASMMAVCSVTAARLMDGSGDGSANGQALLVVAAVLMLGAAMGALNGALIVVTRVPDIVVTLAMLFVWQGVALLILNAPGGGAAPWLRALIVGGVTLPGVPPVLTEWLPKSLVVLLVCLAVIWLPIKRSKLGLQFYAVGSDSLAAFRSGVPVGRTRIAAYAVAGLFAALGGIAVTMSTGIGEPIPGPYLLASVAAVVLGGVTLGGGRGGLIGPILAVLVLRLVRMDLTLLSVDPNVTAIVEGSIMVAVVMFGGVLAMRTDDVTMTDPQPGPGARLLRFAAENPLAPLIGLLILLLAVLEIINPGIISGFWIANTVKVAIPLAMLAACQTLTMLTGGIDLSAGTAATIAGYVTATLAPLIGVPAAMAIGLGCALSIGLVNGFGVAVCRVHPLIMTLGSALIAMGCLLVYQRYVISTGVLIPEMLVWLGTGRTWGLPNGLFLFVPFAALIIFIQRRTGFGRLLYAIGSNEAAARLSGVRAWQVLFALYALSGFIAGVTGLLYLGLVKTASLSLALPLDLQSVAVAVIGGTSIFGGRGGYGGTIVGALILRVLITMLTLLALPEGARTILFGAIILAVTALYFRLTEKG